MAHTVVVTAATGPLGQRVCALAAADPAVDRVVAIDQPGRPGAAETARRSGRFRGRRRSSTTAWRSTIPR